MDRLDSISWLDEAQRSSRHWKERFYRLRAMFRLPDEILNSPDPVAAILESHRHGAKAEQIINGERSRE